MRKLLIILSLIIFTSFTFLNKEKNKLTGTWLYSKYENEISELVKVDRFDKNKDGIAFTNEGKLIVRQNVGDCATPPITYGNTKGTWNFTSDSTLTMKYDFWDGKIEEDWKILTMDSIRLTKVTTDYRIVRVKR